MSDDIWTFPRLKRERFAAAALAIAWTKKQQPFDTATSADDEELSDDDTIRPRDLVASVGKLALQKKFLNRTAEILARQKTSPKARAQTSTDADHASAAMLGFKNEIPHVYVAKNAGLDATDDDFLAKLQMWLRAVSLTGQRRDIQKDRFWCLLVEYNRSRLEFYISELAGIKGAISDASVRKLQASCKSYERGPKDWALSLRQTIADAYQLRYATLPQERPKVVRLIGLLSRLRAVWETLQEFAMHHLSCKDVEVHAIPASDVAEIPFSTIVSELEGLEKDLSNKVLGTSKKRKEQLELYTHAEIQLLLLFGSLKQALDSTRFVRYIGSSKKTCWLCEQTLRRQSGFSSRGTHAEVSAFWTVETKDPLEFQFQFDLAKGLCAIQDGLVDRVRRPSKSSRPAVPQSTPAVTSSGSAITEVKRGHRRQRRDTDQSSRSVTGTSRDEIPQVCGRRLNRIDAIRLPADGESAHVVNLDICENLAGSEFTSWLASVPDFRPFWGDVLHAQQDYHTLDVEKDEDENEANLGLFKIFYNTSEELPRNECIASMLGLREHVDGTGSRMFWQGDVFVIRFDETAPDGGAFLSLPAGAEIQRIVNPYIQHEWKRHGLEELRESGKDVRESSERHARNREMIRARLTPLEAEILSHLPPGLEQNLEYLAIHNADYGAMTATWSEPYPEDPSMVNIHYMKRIDHLEKMGWEGFTASDL